MRYRFIYSTLLICLANIAFSQSKELHIQYDFYFKDYYPEERQISVIANYEESLSTITRTIMYKERGETNYEPKSWFTHVFKTKDSLFYKETAPTGIDYPYFVKESLNQMKWNLTGNYKSVLNYNCQEATSIYRGREYIAYFTTKIPFKAAPWKFHGLPGVLLAVKTSDNKITIEARELQIKPISGSLENPYLEIEKWITWDSFKELYKKSSEDFKNKTVSQLSSVGKSGHLLGKPKIREELRMEIIVDGNGGYENP
jgi:GLPGLI family protein